MATTPVDVRSGRRPAPPGTLLTAPAALVLVVLLLAQGAIAPAAAQVSTTAVLRGEVTDSAGQPVATADVTLRDSTEIVAGTRTDAAGRYILVGLPAGGPYQLRVEALGYGTVTRSPVRLAAGESRRLNVVLESRPVQLEEVRVVAAPDLIFSGTRTGAATVIEERTVESLPSLDRDITGFAALSPMVAVDREAISVAGQNTRYNSLRIDGAVSQDLFGLSPSGVPGGQANAKPLPLDAIRQYSVLVAPYDVRHSGFTGGLLNAVTRSGGDAWSATAFGYLRADGFAGAPLDDARRSDARGPADAASGEVAGFTVGGPVGAARVFVAGEYEDRRRPVPGFNIEQAGPQRTGLLADSVARIAEILRSSYGLLPGDASGYTLDNPLGNAFVRLDLPLGGRHDLAVHYNWIAAEEAVPPNRLAINPYDFDSAASRRESRTHSGMARVASRLGEHTTNELLLNVQRTADLTRARSTAPQVEVRVASRITDPEGNAQTLFRRVRAGADPLAHANELDQTAVQLADNISHAVGDHLFTTGLDLSWYGVRRRFLPASRGIWRFDSIEDLESNAPSSYERLVLGENVDPDIEFSALRVAGYVQDEWSVTDDLSLTLGLRLDLPLTLSRPGYNREAEVVTGVVTDHLPSGGALFSPRAGFNWSPATRRRLQLRGGIGIFTGTPPLAWLADAYTDTGLRTGFLLCDDNPNNPPAPPLNPASPPEFCANGAAPLRRNITVFDEQFRYPQDLRASLALDRELPWGIVATVEALYTRALNQVALEDLNLGALTADPEDAAALLPGLGARELFGTPLLIPTRFGPFMAGRRWPEYGHVIRVGNRSRNAALAVVAELQRRFADRLDVRLGYTYTQGVDVRGLQFESATLNYGLTPIRRDPARPEPRPSSFARPHRVVGSVWARLLEWGDGLDVTVFYVGQSGLPYSYAYASDLNGDGFPGPGALEEAYNDLFFVPSLLTQVPGGAFAAQAMVFQLVARDPCLTAAKNFILSRNECRTPWSNRLDLRLSQGIPVGGGTVRIVADLMNVLNLLDPEWGLVHVVPPVVPIYEISRRSACPGLTCSSDNPLIGTYVGPRERDPETGLSRAALPYIPAFPESVWRAQLGVRVSF